MVTVEIPVRWSGNQREEARVSGAGPEMTIEISVSGRYPKGMDVDVVGLMIGDSIHVRDLSWRR